jgi:hypothetical protein
MCLASSARSPGRAAGKGTMMLTTTHEHTVMTTNAATGITSHSL